MAIPTVTSLTPFAAGPVGATQYWLQIHGEHFLDGGGVSAVDFGAGMTTDYFSVIDDFTIDVGIIIGGALGTRTISVTNGDGTGTLVDGYAVTELLAPNINDLNPIDTTQGYQSQTYTVLLYAYAYFTDTSNVVFDSGITVNSFTVIYDNCIEASITIADDCLIGLHDFTVTNTEGSDTAVGVFEVLGGLPDIIAVAPKYGEQSETLNVHVFGIHFTGVTDADFGADCTVNLLAVVSDTEVEINLTIGGAATIGNIDVYLENALGWSIVPGQFFVMPKANIVGCSSSCTVVAGTYGGGLIAVLGNGSPV